MQRIPITPVLGLLYMSVTDTHRALICSTVQRCILLLWLSMIAFANIHNNNNLVVIHSIIIVTIVTNVEYIIIMRIP